MPQTRDIVRSFIISIMTAFFILPFIYNNLQARISFSKGAVFAVIILPVVSLAGLFIAKILSKYFAPFWRLAKFIQLGVLNTIIDIGTFNVITFFTNTTSGVLIGGVNAPGFIIAVTNSYLWNKFWVFEDNAEKRSYSDFWLFLVVSVTSLFVNSLIVFVVTTYIPHAFGLNDIQWANLGKGIASIASFIWNFTGYKLFVFVKPATPQGIPPATA